MYRLYLYNYYVTLMAKCMCAWLHHPLKLLPSSFLPCVDSGQPEWFYAETYMGLWFANTACAAAKIDIELSTTIDWKIISSCTNSLHKLRNINFYAWTNRLTHYSTCNLPIQLLLCLNKILLTSTWQQAQLNIKQY